MQIKSGRELRLGFNLLRARCNLHTMHLSHADSQPLPTHCTALPLSSVFEDPSETLHPYGSARDNPCGATLLQSLTFANVTLTIQIHTPLTNVHQPYHGQIRSSRGKYMTKAQQVAGGKRQNIHICPPQPLQLYLRVALFEQ